MGAPDKESMQDRITALQRQVTDMTEDRKQAHILKSPIHGDLTWKNMLLH
jgi:hypothetical protein